jgi:hypothetical protein
MRVIIKGDFTGHPFRGNQWTSKGGLWKVFEKKTHMPMYDNMLANPKYFREQKGMVFKIETMTPDEYMAECAKGQHSTIMQEERTIDRNKVDKYAKLMQSGEKFPMPVIEHGKYGMIQEGRHRALAAKQIGVKNIPVMVVRWL